ncbi:MAG: alpha/beta hydrolase [Chlorobium phaeobacteroides]|uniref:Alpha/beta hydrolase fold n=1 Tax=Chlorobium phaeobacteroides (strain BS1) TaxID=331678 RepID=B3EK63_CHLPB|nr:alpha/beta hydrolase [Chlorobium phaeobacteroides]
MPVKECAPTKKFREYQAELKHMELSGNADRADMARYELELMGQSRFVKINGVVHHYHVSGPQDATETVLLVHGWDCWWMWWHRVIRELNEKGVRTIAYDLKGHGWSDPDPGQDYSISSFSHDLAEMVRQLEVKEFHIAAFSFGPFVVLDYAQKTTDRVKSIVVYNFGYLPNNAFLERLAPSVLTLTFNTVLRKIHWWRLIYVYARVVLARNPVSFHDIMVGQKSLELCCPEVVQKTTKQITSREVTRSLPDIVNSIDIPVLFVAGAGDTIMSSHNTRKLSGYAKNGSYVSVPKCGHLITLELPGTASDLIISHMKSVQGESYGKK